MTLSFKIIFTREFWNLFFFAIRHPIQFGRDSETLSELADMHRAKALSAIAAYDRGDFNEFKRRRDEAEKIFRAYSQEWERITGYPA